MFVSQFSIDKDFAVLPHPHCGSPAVILMVVIEFFSLWAPDFFRMCVLADNCLSHQPNSLWLEGQLENVAAHGFSLLIVSLANYMDEAGHMAENFTICENMCIDAGPPDHIWLACHQNEQIKHSNHPKITVQSRRMTPLHLVRISLCQKIRCFFQLTQTMEILGRLLWSFTCPCFVSLDSAF